MLPLESVFTPENAQALEELYEKFQHNDSTLPPGWADFFRQMEKGTNGHAKTNGNGHASSVHIPKLTSNEAETIRDLHIKALLLLLSYRRHGHFHANTDPLGMDVPEPTHFNLEEHGLLPEDLDKEVQLTIGGSVKKGKLGDFVKLMQETYCAHMGVEFFYIRDEERRNWLIEKLESDAIRAPFTKDEKKRTYEKLFNSEYFEKFVATRFPGKKRFSLEGGESLIPTLDKIVDISGEFQIKEMVLGMAHRGRLNVLANILGKNPALIFAEFNENVSEDNHLGDVKYHLGYSNDIPTTSGNRVHLSLGFNPSHLEVINPVVLGSVRARQTKGADHQRVQYLPVIIHGDAAFSGQGINYEILNMSHLPGYTVGGTFHIICNNQVGFTTNPSDGRSTPYATDLAKMLQVPIIHVNGDDPEACIRAVRLCMEWRQKFHTDVFIDLICYRRWGHNETDEPMFTQPVMYKRIKETPTTFQKYEARLLQEGMPQDELDAIKHRCEARLEAAHKRVVEERVHVEMETLKGNWSGFKKDDPDSDPETGVSETILRDLTNKLTALPTNFEPNPKIKRLLDQRHAMVLEPNGRLDWGMGETLAYATLINEGTCIRLSGQDVKRGTFSHRHSVLFDAVTGSEHTPLNNLGGSGRIEIINSLLSEEAVLGFEFGYTLADPRTLVIWEAQFGDFANGAQVIIDQFISSCEAKWNRMSGLVMLLPHGYEGQGPEHSSARLERYLQLCSQNNIQVVNASTPAQFFHMMRRQINRNFRKPLIVMSPKSLLRLPDATNPLEDFTRGKFQEVLEETNPTIEPSKVNRILLCTGKIYYELITAREKQKVTDIAIARVEQLYPYPVQELQSVLSKYPNAKEIGWVQEEPRNQGAWIYIENRLEQQIGDKQDLLYFGRVAAPSPATGYFKVHQKEQAHILDMALSKKVGE